MRAVESRNSSGSLRSEEHTSELQSRPHLVCRLLLEKKKVATRMIPAIRKMKSLFEAVSRLLSLIGFSMASPYSYREAFFIFFFNDTATTEIYTLSLHVALPI